MEEIIKLVANYGISVVIISLFLWDWIANKKRINDTLEQNEKYLEEIKCSNGNISKALDMLQKSIDNQNEFLTVHDKRCGNIETDIKEINYKIEK